LRPGDEPTGETPSGILIEGVLGHAAVDALFGQALMDPLDDVGALTE